MLSEFILVCEFGESFDFYFFDFFFRFLIRHK